MATVLVVGADKGIARCMVDQLVARGDSVHAACLFDGAGQPDGVTVHPNVDVTSDDDVARLAAALAAGDVQLDWLCHVAGVLGVDELGQIDMGDVRRQFEINGIGPLRVVQALLDRLHEGSKVGIVSSRVGSLADNTSGGMYAYRVSKAAANMVGLNLHYDLSKKGVSVLMLHPGLTATELTKDFPRSLPWIEPEVAAEGLIRNMENLSLETSGKFQHSNGEWLPW